MKLSLFNWVHTSWEEARGYLHEDLEHIQAAINRWSNQTTDSNTGTLQGSAIQGAILPVPQYVSNEGLTSDGQPAPKWALVDVSVGVKSRLQFSHLIAAPTGSLLVGRPEGAGGDYGPIPLGPGLVMIGGVLNTSGTGGGGGVSTHYDCPLSDGDLLAADLIYAAGECIIVQVPL